MALTLDPDARKQAISSIKQYAVEQLEQEIGDLQAGLLLDYFLKELAPTIYNRGVRDAQTYVQDRLSDLEGACFEREFGYWAEQPGKTRRK